MLVLVENPAQGVGVVGRPSWSGSVMAADLAGVGEARVRPAGVVEGFELAQDAQEVVLVRDQGTVEEFPF
jgi:hypothetical protein